MTQLGRSLVPGFQPSRVAGHPPKCSHPRQVLRLGAAVDAETEAAGGPGSGGDEEEGNKGVGPVPGAFTCSSLVSPPVPLRKRLITILYCTGRHWGSERLSHLPSVTQLVSSGAKIQTHAACPVTSVMRPPKGPLACCLPLLSLPFLGPSVLLVSEGCGVGAWWPPKGNAVWQ